jgi:hypothetical protein
MDLENPFQITEETTHGKKSKPGTKFRPEVTVLVPQKKVCPT